jgi:hypothetical protein
MAIAVALIYSSCTADPVSPPRSWPTPTEQPSDSLGPELGHVPVLSPVKALDGYRGHSVNAIATVYHAVAGQTDDSPLITADGTKIDLDALGAAEIRYCAVSRDLLHRWGGPIRYGDSVRVTGAGQFSGFWMVRDTMNRRYGKTCPVWDKGVKGVVEPHELSEVEVDGNHHIDFLVPEGVMGKFEDVTITLILGTVMWGHSYPKMNR